MKWGSDKRPPKAVAPRGSGGMLPQKIFNFYLGPLKINAISSVLMGNLKWFNCSKVTSIFVLTTVVMWLVHFFLTSRLLYVFKYSLGGLTEPPEPPLDPPQIMEAVWKL